MVTEVLEPFELEDQQLGLLDLVLVDLVELVFFGEDLLGEVFFLLVQEGHFDGDV